MTVGVLECAALCGAAPGLHSEIDTAAELLGELADEWGRTPEDRWRRIAPAAGHRPGRSTAPGRRRRSRGAGRPSSTRTPRPPPSGRSCRRPTTTRSASGSAAARPGAVRRGLPRGPRPAPARPAPHRADRRRGRARRRAGAARPARGETPLERVLSLVMLGDLVSVYLAELDGVDPDAGRGDRALQGTRSPTNLDTIVVRFAVAWRGSRSTRPRRPPAGRRECCATSRTPA